MTNTLRKIAIGGLILVTTNLSSFSTVAMEKYISKYSNETSAVTNAFSSVPILYDIGFSLGHKVFYNDANFMQTARNEGLSNSIPRPHLSFLESL